jgi:hypothetical protein
MDSDPRLFGENELSILRIFATRAGAELERTRAHTDVRRLNSELAVLLDISRAIGRHLDRDKVFGAIAGCLKTLVPTERFGIEFPIEGDKLQGIYCPERRRMGSRLSRRCCRPPAPRATG